MQFNLREAWVWTLLKQAKLKGKSGDDGGINVNTQRLQHICFGAYRQRFAFIAAMNHC